MKEGPDKSSAREVLSVSEDKSPGIGILSYHPSKLGFNYFVVVIQVEGVPDFRIETKLSPFLTN